LTTSPDQPRPDGHANPKGIANWKFNDTYAKVLIMRNISESYGQMVHAKQSRTSHDMWTDLEAVTVHEFQSHEANTSYIRNHFCTYAEEGISSRISINSTGKALMTLNDP
jgi:hypothetical protein